MPMKYGFGWESHLSQLDICQLIGNMGFWLDVTEWGMVTIGASNAHSEEWNSPVNNWVPEKAYER